MTTNVEADRRRHPRVPVTLLVQHRASTLGPQELDYASDLSVGGMFIQTDQPAEVGTTLHLTFAPLKDAALVEAYCRVARVSSRGMAAQFIQLDEDAAGLLARRLAG